MFAKVKCRVGAKSRQNPMNKFALIAIFVTGRMRCSKYPDTSPGPENHEPGRRETASRRARETVHRRHSGTQS